MMVIRQALSLIHGWLDDINQRISTLGREISQMIIEQQQRSSRGSASPYTTDIHTTGGSSMGYTLSHASPMFQQSKPLKSKVTEMDHSFDRCLSSSLDQELTLQRATYNGILLWKIDDFTQHKREAVDGVTLSLYSTPFYTSQHGYKMCVRVYLNGDGLGKGTHLSVFFVIMRGPFNTLLRDSFKQKLMLTLLNQDDISVGLHKEFDLCCNCSKRNMQSGCLCFPLSSVQNYLKDNSLKFLFELSEPDIQPDIQPDIELDVSI